LTISQPYWPSDYAVVLEVPDWISEQAWVQVGPELCWIIVSSWHCILRLTRLLFSHKVWYL